MIVPELSIAAAQLHRSFTMKNMLYYSPKKFVHTAKETLPQIPPEQWRRAVRTVNAANAILVGGGIGVAALMYWIGSGMFYHPLKV